jgi:hypothetical protein
MSIDELCKRCTQLMGDEVKTWRIIKNILDVSLNYPYLTSESPKENLGGWHEDEFQVPRIVRLSWINQEKDYH